MFYDESYFGLHLGLFIIVTTVAWWNDKQDFWLTALFVAIFFNNVVFHVGEVNVRLDYILCAIVLLIEMLSRGRMRLYRRSFVFFLFLVSLLISTLANAPALFYGLRKLGIVVTYVVTAVLVIGNAVKARELEARFERFIRVGNIVLLMSIAGYFLSYSGIDFGFLKDRLGAFWLKGPMLNANLFGSTAAALGVLNLWMTLYDQGRKWTYRSFFFLSVVGVFLSYTRTAWAFFALFFLFSILLARRFNIIKDMRPVLMTVLSVAVVALLFGNVLAVFGFESKLESFFDFDVGSGVVRLAAFEEGLNDWLRSPVVGRGFETFEYETGAAEDPNQLMQIIFFLQILQYGGLAALSFFLFLMFLLHRNALRFIRTADERSRSKVVALVLAFDLLVCSYQISSGMVLPFFWFILAFLWSFVERPSSNVRDPQVAISR